MDPRPHALYRFYADDGSLLYVGITLDPGQRWREHRASKPWWSDVRTIRIEEHPDRHTVLEAERRAIAAERPKYNIVHNHEARVPLPAPSQICPPDLREQLDEISRLSGLGLAGIWNLVARGRYRVARERADLVASAQMPDDCHDQCVCAGLLAVYLPYAWHRGRAFYECVNGHSWDCWWGHDLTGFALENRGTASDGPWTAER